MKYSTLCGCWLGWAQGIVLDGSPKVLRDVAIATSFGIQCAISGFLAFCGLYLWLYDS